jgi:hypothetical protein
LIRKIQDQKYGLLISPDLHCRARLEGHLAKAEQQSELFGSTGHRPFAGGDPRGKRTAASTVAPRESTRSRSSLTYVAFAAAMSWIAPISSADVVTDPEPLRPKIRYRAHREEVPHLLQFFPGLRAEDFPQGEAWAVEELQLSTHSGSHMDAPWHFHSTTDNGARRSPT